jgi:hypothetical protein
VTHDLSPDDIARQFPDWRKEMPLAAAERSEPMGAFQLTDRMPDGAEHWENERYNVTVRRYDRDPVFGSRYGMIQLGISAADGTALHDWRDFQAIKNRFAGAEAEAFELYPAEARLMDPSNYYTLWCFPKTRIRVGTDTRRVMDADTAFAPQRKLAEVRR